MQYADLKLFTEKNSARQKRAFIPLQMTILAIIVLPSRTFYTNKEKL